MLPNPTLFDIELHWYPFFHWLGFFLGVFYGIYYYKKQYSGSNQPIKLLLIMVFTVCCMLVGARLAGMVEAFVAMGTWPDPSIIWQSPSKGRFRWAGSVAAIFVLVSLVAKLLKMKNYKRYLDVLVLSLCIITLITKQGCLFAGDGCYGIPTALPWGMYFPYGAAPNILPVHPTPIYDGLFHLLLFVFLLRWDRKYKKFEGQTAHLYFLATSIFYILLETIRINPKTSIGLTVPQIIYALILLVTISALFLKKRKSRPRKISNPRPLFV